MEEVTRMNTRLFKTLSLIAIVALLVCGQAIAADNSHHYTIKIGPRTTQQDNYELPPANPTANLYALAQYFGATPQPFGTNTDGTELWPCVGTYNSASGTASENPDCPTIGDPSQGFPFGGIVIGLPAYQFPLAACNATSTSAAACGNIETWYEDDTGDSTDDLTYAVVVTQGANTIAASGTIDYGPNALGNNGSLGLQVGLFSDWNVGTQGQTGGINNGPCDGPIWYPLPGPTFPGGPYETPSDKTCVAAVAGAVTITATTELAVPTYTKQTKVSSCTPIVNGEGGTPVGPPCWTVKYTKKYSVMQKWTIWLN
jgi:hypothetical protein